jgi:hypothetical protein
MTSLLLLRRVLMVHRGMSWWRVGAWWTPPSLLRARRHAGSRRRTGARCSPPSILHAQRCEVAVKASQRHRVQHHHPFFPFPIHRRTLKLRDSHWCAKRDAPARVSDLFCNARHEVGDVRRVRLLSTFRRVLDEPFLRSAHAQTFVSCDF